MLKLAEGSIRVLHRASGLAADYAAGDQAGRASELHKEAERSLRMAKVLATGGFAEEAPILIAKTIGCIAAAKLAALGPERANFGSQRESQSAEVCRLIPVFI